MLFEINQSINQSVSQSVTTQSFNQPINVNTWDIRAWRCPGIWTDSVFVTHSCGLLKYRISSNDSLGRLFLFSHQKGAIIRRKATIIRRRRLFEIFLTGGRALNILFYYT